MFKNILLRFIGINVIFAVLMSIYRIIFTAYYSSGINILLQQKADLLQAFILGFRYDFAILAYINSIPLLLLLFLFFINTKSLIIKLIKYLKYYYTLFIGCIISVLCIDFGFYSYFQEHINILIFGIFEDDTAALFSTLAENYPVILVALCFCAVFVFVFIFTKYILEKNINNFKVEKINVKYKIIISFLLIIINFISARGSFGLFPLGVDNAEISNNTFINKVAINAIYTLQAAVEARLKENRGFDYIDKMGYRDNINQAFADYLNTDISDIDKDNPLNSLKRTTKYNKILEEIKPNVVLIVMEAFGTDLIKYNSDTFNVLGELKRHLDEDVTFYNFLPGHMGTIGSLEAVITNIARLPQSRYLCQSKYAYNKYIFSGPVPFKQQGYETVFMYGGNAGWRNTGAYMPNLGFNTIIGEGSMDKNYERNQWGVYDEFLFGNIFNVLNSDNKPKFIYVLTTSNHPPYSLPSTYKKLPLKISDELQNRITGDQKLSEMRFATYQYASQKAGEFLSELKKSKYADNTIVAITGDHNFWSTFSYTAETQLDAVSVPFYIYIPKNLLSDKTKINTELFASHTDIMPTLYELSLSSASYIAMGSSLLTQNAVNNTASNDMGIIMNTKFAVLYDFNSNNPKYYQWNKNIKREIINSEHDQEHDRMLKHYKAGVAIADYMLKNNKGLIQ